MKKAYSLDYTIETDTERMEAVRQILDELPTTPSSKDLEQMASYVLYGKDESGQNAVQRKEVDDRDMKRYNTYKRADEKVESLDGLLENPLTDESQLRDFNQRYVYMKKHKPIKRPRYDKEGNMIDPGDSDLPGIQEIWDAIDHLEHTYNANCGLVEFNPDDSVITDPYRLWQLKHMIVDLRRHQYYLRDYYKPMLHFNTITVPQPQLNNWDEDTAYWIDEELWRYKVEHSYLDSVSKNLEDYETRINERTHKLEIKWVVRRQTFDWENSWHIRCLIDHYSSIYMQVYDKLDSWGRTLIYDFDRYFDMCNFSPVRSYVVLRRIDRLSAQQIADEVKEKFGLQYNESTINNMINKEIPKKMAQVAMKDRAIKETPLSQCKKCARCKRTLPATPLFFVRNHTKLFGFESSCKDCQRARRIERGEQTGYDRRNKEAQMLKMQTRETNT